MIFLFNRVIFRFYVSFRGSMFQLGGSTTNYIENCWWILFFDLDPFGLSPVVDEICLKASPWPQSEAAPSLVSQVYLKMHLKAPDPL